MQTDVYNDMTPGRAKTGWRDYAGEFWLFYARRLLLRWGRLRPDEAHLRLIDVPEGLADLIYQHYLNFAPATKQIISLWQVYVPRQ